MIQEFCLVPKKIIDEFELNKTDQNNKDTIQILSKNTTLQPYTNPSEYKIDLKDKLKSILKSKFDKGYSIYLWLKENEKHLEYLKNGDMITPISNINIINFINDVVSKNKSISQEQLNKYKLFTNIVQLPEYFIENVKLKEYLYPNNTSLKKTVPVNNTDDIGNSNINISPINLRSQSKKRKTAGNIHYVTSLNPINSKDKKKAKKLSWLTF